MKSTTENNLLSRPLRWLQLDRTMQPLSEQTVPTGGGQQSGEKTTISTKATTRPLVRRHRPLAISLIFSDGAMLNTSSRGLPLPEGERETHGGTHARHMPHHQVLQRARERKKHNKACVLSPRQQ